MEKFFDQLLEKFLPEYAYESYDDEVHPPNRKYRRILSDWRIVHGANNTSYFSLWNYGSTKYTYMFYTPIIFDIALLLIKV